MDLWGMQAKKQGREPWAGRQPGALGKGLPVSAVPLLLPGHVTGIAAISPPASSGSQDKGTNPQGVVRIKCHRMSEASTLALLSNNQRYYKER